MHIHVQLYIFFAICIHIFYAFIPITQTQVLSNLDYKQIKAITKRQNVSDTKSAARKKLPTKNEGFKV
jgi:hypothetical protein